MTENVCQPHGDATVIETVLMVQMNLTAHTDQDVDQTDSDVQMDLVVFLSAGFAMVKLNVEMDQMKLDAHKKVSGVIQPFQSEKSSEV